jgi:hypothetical protein
MPGMIKKSGFSGGNLGAQKYEARRNMELFSDAVHKAQPSKDTTSWRDGPAKLYKPVDGRLIQKKRILKMENEELGKKIHNIHHEPRRAATREYVPGWRIGNISGGMCIDCYRTDNPLVKVYHKLHNFKEKRKAVEKRIARDDAILKKNISKLASDLAPSVHKKEYEYNRYRARFFFNKKENATVLHLGLKKGATNTNTSTSKGRPQSASAVRTIGKPLSGGHGDDDVVKYYTGPNANASPPRPSSGGVYNHGSNLCYTLRPEEQSSPTRGGTGGFSLHDMNLITDPNGKYIADMNNEIENDRLLLHSSEVRHLRPQVESDTGRVLNIRKQIAQAAKTMRRPESAPLHHNTRHNQQHEVEEVQILEEKGNYYHDDDKISPEENFTVQLNGMKRMFPIPYSDNDLELFEGAYVAEQEKEKYKESMHNLRTSNIKYKKKENVQKAQKELEIAQDGVKFLTKTRSLDHLKMTRPTLREVPDSMRERDPWSNESSRPDLRGSKIHIYDHALAAQRLNINTLDHKGQFSTTRKSLNSTTHRIQKKVSDHSSSVDLENNNDIDIDNISDGNGDDEKEEEEEEEDENYDPPSFMLDFPFMI